MDSSVVVMDERPVPGTVVCVRAQGRVGVVMPYEMQWQRPLFPVRFAGGIGEIMTPGEVDEVPAVEDARP